MRRDSAGLAAPRALFLLAAAVILGVVLLQKFDKGTDPFGQSVRATGSETTETTKARSRPRSTTTSLVPATTVPPRPLIEIKVLAVNGTNKAGVAGRVRDQLQRAGYNALSPDNTKQPVEATSVQYAAGHEAEARGVAALLGLPETTVVALTNPPPVADTRMADVVLVVGPDLAARLGPAPTTATTRRAAVTSTTAVRPSTTVSTGVQPIVTTTTLPR